MHKRSAGSGVDTAYFSMLLLKKPYVKVRKAAGYYEKLQKSEKICKKGTEMLDSSFKRGYNTILHQYAQ